MVLFIETVYPIAEFGSQNSQIENQLIGTFVQ
jgi:hypothetical protein